MNKTKKMKKLENYGVQEMNAKEIKETEGGFVDPISITVGAAVCIGAGVIVIGVGIGLGIAYLTRTE